MWGSMGGGTAVAADVVRLLRARRVRVEEVIYLVQSKAAPLPSADELGGATLVPMVVPLSDPTHHRAIYDGVCDGVLARLGALRAPLHVNVSSGTPAMHAVWLVIHAGGAFPPGTKLWSAQRIKAENATRLDPVDFSIETYLAAVRRGAALRPTEAHYDPECRSPSRREALERLRRYARLRRAPVLVLGERGTGKTRLVETFVGPLKDRTRVLSIACGTIDPQLAMSQLFGHKRGAFTGADEDRPGFIEEADGGILFLDEVQDLAPPVQRQLVRVLQDPRRRFRRVGESKDERESDVEIVCASHQPLNALRRCLDPDLFDRLSALLVEIPPLRDCRADVRDDWAQVWAEARSSSDVPGESPWNDAIERALTADPLPGNLRDLQRLAWLLMAHGTALAGGAALREWVEMQARLREAEPGDGDGKLPDALSRGTWKERLASRPSRSSSRRKGGGAMGRTPRRRRSYRSTSERCVSTPKVRGACRRDVGACQPRGAFRTATIRPMLRRPAVMTQPAPTSDQALCFYRAALSTARLIDRESDHRVLDADADAAWRAYGGDLPAVVRCDLVLRNFAMLYPAAFAPGPVFGLSGWYNDDPWGTGFERPAAQVVEALFTVRASPPSPADALDHALTAWGLITASPPDARLSAILSPSTNVLVVGARALAEVAHAFLRGARLSALTQIFVVSDRPSNRHILGITCALLRESGVPHLVDCRRQEGETAEGWADREKQRLGAPRARFLVESPDADAGELESARALAKPLGADETLLLVAS